MEGNSENIQAKNYARPVLAHHSKVLNTFFQKILRPGHLLPAPPGSGGDSGRPASFPAVFKDAFQFVLVPPPPGGCGGAGLSFPKELVGLGSIRPELISILTLSTAGLWEIEGVGPGPARCRGGRKLCYSEGTIEQLGVGTCIQPATAEERQGFSPCMSFGGGLATSIEANTPCI